MARLEKPFLHCSWGNNFIFIWKVIIPGSSPYEIIFNLLFLFNNFIEFKCSPLFLQPRSNEGAGSTGWVRSWPRTWKGPPIEIGVELTAAHRGFFEFRLCPHNDRKRPVSPDCLDRYLLQRTDGSGPKYEECYMNFFFSRNN